MKIYQQSTLDAMVEMIMTYDPVIETFTNGKKETTMYRNRNGNDVAIVTVYTGSKSFEALYERFTIDANVEETVNALQSSNGVKAGILDFVSAK